MLQLDMLTVRAYQMHMALSIFNSHTGLPRNSTQSYLKVENPLQLAKF